MSRRGSQAVSHSRTTDEEVLIVRLYPAEDGSPIEIDLLKYYVRDINFYFETVSGAWGDEEPDVVIQCNGALASITPSFSSVLHEIRSQTTARNYLFDIFPNKYPHATFGSEYSDVCTAEVYSKAANMIIWLGEEEDDTSEALTFIHKLCHFSRENRHMDETTRYDKYEEIFIPMPNHRASITALTSLTNHSWFRERSVQIKILTSRDARILIGCRTLPWKTLSDAILAIPPWSVEEIVGEMALYYIRCKAGMCDPVDPFP